MRNIHGGVLAITLVSGSLTSMDCGAQEAGDKNILEGVVVTAQRVEQSLQTVPISVTALSDEALTSMGVTETNDLQYVVPSLVVSTLVGNTQPYMRGIGTQSALIGLESSVAQYLDGVYISSLNGTVYSLNNVQRIEVLRGPQGTLFGRNTTGGVVSIVSRAPGFDPGIEVGTTYGNYETATADLYLQGGLSDSLAANLSVYGRNQGEGYGRNLALGRDINENDEVSTRAQFLVQAGEIVKILYSADWSKQDNDLGANRNPYLDTRDALGGTRTGSPLDGNYSLQPYARTQQWGISQDLRADFDWASLRSITALRKYDFDINYDQDLTPTPVVAVIRNESVRTLQQEVLLSREADLYTWTAGLMYFGQYSSIEPTQVFLAPGSAGNTGRYAEADLTSYAAYGQVSRKLGKFTLTGGLRYTDERTTYDGDEIASQGHPLPVGTVIRSRQNARIQAQETTWRAALDYEISDSIMAYGSASTGFKTGGFNMASVLQAPTDPEKVRAYELGMKTELLDHRMRVNVSAFHYDYDDVQMNSVTLGGVVTLNAARATIDGAELEVNVLPPVPVGKLQLGLTGSFLDAQYDEFPNAPYFLPNPFTAPPPGVTCPVQSSAAAGGATQCVYDAKGADLIRTPHWTTSLNALYSVSTAIGEFDFSGNYFYSDSFYWEPSNITKQAPYGVLNLRAGFTLPDGSWSFYLYGRNVTDETHYTQVGESTLGAGATADLPRIYGIGIDYKLGAR